MASNHGYSDEELALLTPEELAGLLEEDEEEEELPEEEELHEELPISTSRAGADAAANGGEGTAGSNAADAAAAAAEIEPDNTGRDAPVTTKPKPLIKADVPENLQAQLDDIARQRGDLRTRFNDGDLTTEEYENQLDALNDQRDDLRWAQRKANLSQETTRAQMEAKWETAVESFMPNHPEISSNQTRFNAFNAIVMELTAPIVEAGGQPGKEQLEQALKQWREDLGIETTGKPATTETTGKVRKTVPSLANVPAASSVETDDGKYADLDRLADRDPEAYEAAIAKMSESEWEAYSNSH